MELPKIHESEYRFCLILWEHEPVTAVDLAKLCLERLGWKRTTTYTVIKRLGERGVLKNENGTVTSLVKSKLYYAASVTQIDKNKTAQVTLALYPTHYGNGTSYITLAKLTAIVAAL